MFQITRNKGFGIKFSNGWVISVQWGEGNYCDNLVHDLSNRVAQSRDAEIGIYWEWGATDAWQEPRSGLPSVNWLMTEDFASFRWYLSPDMVAKWIDRVKHFVSVEKMYELDGRVYVNLDEKTEDMGELSSWKELVI